MPREFSALYYVFSILPFLVFLFFAVEGEFTVAVVVINAQIRYLIKIM